MFHAKVIFTAFGHLMSQYYAWLAYRVALRQSVQPVFGEAV
jgi:hypothetical protein